MLEKRQFVKTAGLRDLNPKIDFKGLNINVQLGITPSHPHKSLYLHLPWFLSLIFRKSAIPDNLIASSHRRQLIRIWWR